MIAIQPPIQHAHLRMLALTPAAESRELTQLLLRGYLSNDERWSLHKRREQLAELSQANPKLTGVGQTLCRGSSVIMERGRPRL